MKPEPTMDELALVDEVSDLAGAIWDKCIGVEGLSTDPKMFSMMLFKRLWSNEQGFLLLWKNGFHLESAIILRSAIEASICIAANYEMREAFVALLHGDAIFTVKGQVKSQRSAGTAEGVSEGEGVLRDLESRRPDHVKPARLNWEELAANGRVPQLYGWYRQLSGLSSHVTGASILTAVAPADGPNPNDELKPLQRKMHLMMMAGATLEGCRRHAEVIGYSEGAERAIALLKRLGDLSWDWPGVTRPETGDNSTPSPI